MSENGLIDGLKEASDCILGIRDDLGIGLKPIWFVTRSWSGSEVGYGSAHDTEVQMKWTPHIVDLSLNFRALEGGNVKQGDLLLKGISKKQNPDREVFSPSTLGPGKESFLRVGELLYTVIAVRERYLTWDIQVRPLSDQTRYPA